VTDPQRISAFSPITEAAATDRLVIVDVPNVPGGTKRIDASNLNPNLEITAAETTEGITPTNLLFPPGHIFRYGAVDGANSITAIQNAIKANSHIFIPNGTFFGANILYKSNLRITGESHAAILKLVDNATASSFNGGIVDSAGVFPGNILAATLDDQGGAQFDNGVRAKDETNSTYIFENVIIENLTLDGNKANNQVGDTGENASVMGAGVSINQCNNVTVKNCVFKDHRLEGVFLGYSLHGGSDNCTVHDCHFTGNQRLNIAQVTGKDNTISFNTGTAPTGGTGVTASTAALDIEANLVDEVNFRHTVVGNRLGAGLAIASVAVAKMTSIAVSGNHWIGPLTLGGEGTVEGTVISGDTFVASASTDEWIKKSGPNVSNTDEIPVLIKGCTATGYERVLETQSAGQVENLAVEGCTFNGETFGELSRGFKVSFVDNTFHFTGNTDAFTVQFSNTLGGTVTNQGKVVFDGNTFNGVSNDTTFDFSRDTSWTLAFDDFIFSNNKVYLTGATNSFDIIGSVSLIHNIMTNFKPIAFATLDKTRILENIFTHSSSATDVTGDPDGSTNVIPGLTDTTDFTVGEYVTVSAGFPSATTPLRITALAATTMTLDTASDSSQTNVTITTVSGGLFGGQTGVFNDIDIVGNTLNGVSVQVQRPQDIRIIRNDIKDGVISIVYSFTSAGIGRNSVCFNTLSDTGSRTIPFEVLTGASFLVGDFVDDDNYRYNTFTGYSAQPSIASGVVSAVKGTFPIGGYAVSNLTTDRTWDANAAVAGTGVDVADAGPVNVALLSDHDALVAVVQELSDVVGTKVTDDGMD